MKRSSTSLALRKRTIRTNNNKIRLTTPILEWLKLKKVIVPDVYKNTETLDHSYIAGGIEKNIAILENSLAALLKKKKGEHVITT